MQASPEMSGGGGSCLGKDSGQIRAKRGSQNLTLNGSKVSEMFGNNYGQQCSKVQFIAQDIWYYGKVVESQKTTNKTQKKASSLTSFAP